MQKGEARKNCFLLALKYADYEERGHTLQGLVIGKYQVQGKLDYGSESEIYFASNIQTKQEVAVKLINMRAINRQINQKVKQIRLNCLKNQIQTMLSLDNPYLLKCYEVHENQDFKLLVLQYCNGATLQNYIEQKKKIPQKQAWSIISNIFYGLTELHDNFIVVRDLKADNIIRKNGVFKIANFHYAQKLPIKDQKQQIRGACMGSLKLMAPQIILRKPYGLKIDIWALGIMLFQMVYGDYPYSCQIITHFYNQITKKDYFSKKEAPQMYNYKASPLCFQFMKLTLCIQSQKRANTSKLYEFLLKHDLLYQNQSQDQSLLLQSSKLSSIKFKTVKQIEEYSNLLQQINEECSKVRFIFSKIIYPIQYLSSLCDNREIVQFLFLLSVRCLNTMSVVLVKFKQHKHLCKNLLEYTPTIENVDFLSQETLKYFNIYSDKLTKLENKVTQMITDWFHKKINSESFIKKQRFFLGIQKLQYTKQEQIKYTIKYFKKHVQKHLEEYKQLQSVILHMKIYEQINESVWNDNKSAARMSMVYNQIV